MRIDLRFGRDDSIAATLNSIPRADRPAALRALIRKHAAELPAIAGIAASHEQTPATPSVEPPPAATPAHQPTADPSAAQATRARLAKSLVNFGRVPIVAVLALAGALAFMPLRRAEAGTLDLDYTVSSVHTEAWARRTLNQTNPGLGVAYHWNQTWGVMGGEYLNSYHAPTWYAAAMWTPLHLGRTRGWHLDAGIAAGLASGYGHAHYDTYAWIRDRAAASGWRLATMRHRYMRNPLSPLMAAGLVRIVTPSGIGLNLMIVPNQGPRSSGFVGFQISVPLR